MGVSSAGSNGHACEIGSIAKSSGPLEELGRHKKAVFVLTGMTLVLFLYSQSLNVHTFHSQHGLFYSGPDPREDPDPSSHLVNTPGCKIRTMDPFDGMVDKFFHSTPKPGCGPRRPLVKLVDGTRLLINEALIKGTSGKSDWKFKGATCCWREIRRKNQSPDKYDANADYGVEINPNCTTIPSPGGATPSLKGVQYLKVECVNPLKVKVWQDFFPLTPSPRVLSQSTGNKTRYWAEKAKKVQKNVTNSTTTRSHLPPNIMVIGIDSISRLHMIRSMPRTRELLSSKGFLEMRGYTKVGDNTFPNIMAAFGGMTESETVTKCWPTRQTKVDSCPFIWKNFSALNYVTALVEDSPGIAIFNYDKTGFVTQPVDYYLRPLMVAEHQGAKNRHRFGGANDCLGGGLTPTRVLLRYIQNFVKEVDGLAPFFLLSWFTSVAHDDFNGLSHYDQEFRTFLNTLVSSPVGDNTVLLFISDHGYRFGSFRETFLGFYEESLPFFFIRVPPTLASTHPSWIPALRTNSARLTSPHDLYSTFVHLLGVVSSKTAKNSQPLPPETQPPPPLHAPSLFRVGDLGRNCENSAIPPKYCMCGVSPTLTTSSQLAAELGRIIVAQVNEELVSANLLNGSCSELSYSSFLYGREVGEGEVWNGHGILEPYKDVLLAVETAPWEGRFEARVRIFSGSGGGSGGSDHGRRKQVLGSVGRINSYAGKSDCISHYRMRNYCTCTTLWVEEEKRRRREKDKKNKKKIKGMIKNHRRRGIK